MLQELREKSKSFVTWILVAVMTFMFVIWGIQSYSVHDSQPNVAAKVNGQTIFKFQVQNAYDQLRAMFKATVGGRALSTEQEKNLRSMALEQLIEAEVLQQSARKEGFRTAPQALNAVIVNDPAFQEKGRFSEKLFLARMRNLPYSQEEYMNQLYGDLLVQQVRAALLATGFLPEPAVAPWIQLVEQTRDVAYAVLDRGRWKQDLRLTSSDIQAYYEHHQDDFKTAPRVKLDTLVFSLSDVEKQQKVSENAIKSYYDDNRTEFLRPQEFKATSVLVKLKQNPSEAEVKKARLLAGEIYAAASKQKSSSLIPGSLIVSARLQQKSHANVSVQNSNAWQTADRYPAGLAQALTTLEKPGLEKPGSQKSGALSAPIRTERGFEIFQITERKPQAYRTLEEVRGDIRRRLAQRQAEEQFVDAKDQLADLVFANPKSLQPAAEAMGVKVQSSDWLTRETIQQQPILQHADVVRTVFSPSFSTT